MSRSTCLLLTTFASLVIWSVTSWSLLSKFCPFCSHQQKKKKKVAIAYAPAHSHLHEHFLYPVSINSEGRYNVPTDSKGGYSIEMFEKSMEDYAFPGGAYWAAVARGETPAVSH